MKVKQKSTTVNHNDYINIGSSFQLKPPLILGWVCMQKIPPEVLSKLNNPPLYLF